jgi:hypothetical protein
MSIAQMSLNRANNKLTVLQVKEQLLLLAFPSNIGLIQCDALLREQKVQHSSTIWKPPKICLYQI